MVEELRQYFEKEAFIIRLQNVKVGRVPDDYRVPALRGQARVLSTATIPAYTMIGPYAGKLMTEKEYSNGHGLSVAKKSWEDDYSFIVQTKYEDDERRTKELTIQPYPKYGNETMCINDPHGTGNSANCMFGKFVLIVGAIIRRLLFFSLLTLDFYFIFCCSGVHVQRLALHFYLFKTAD